MAAIPNYKEDLVQYEHVKIRVLVRSENGSGVVIPDHYPFARCSECDTAVFTDDVENVNKAIDAHQKKHHPMI
jgi:hypothetical protein